MLYDYIYWKAYLNLIVKSRIDSSLCLRIVYKELMFLFCLTEQIHYNKNDSHVSLNEFIELCKSLWNQANAGPHRLAGNTSHNMRSLPAFSIIA